MSKVYCEILEGSVSQSILEDGTKMIADAAKAHGGSGNHQAPTDLLAASLGSCILTVMALYAKPLGIDMTGTQAIVHKEQGHAKPGHVGILNVHVYIPTDHEESVRIKLEKGAKNCPVHHSLIESIEQSITFHWGETLQENTPGEISSLSGL